MFALSAATQVDLMLQQCAQFRPRFAVMASEAPGRELARRIKAAGLATEVLWGQQALEDVAAHESVDAVMAAIVGAAGLASCLAAARAGKRLLLANKEALVVGGELFMQAVRQGGATLLPIDSEHSAIFQSLPEDPATWDDAGREDHPHGVRRPVPHARAGDLAQRHARGGLRPSELGDGPQDLGRFGHHDEQGAGSDRGALPVRPGAASGWRW